VTKAEAARDPADDPREVFREVTLRLCGDLDIRAALAETHAFLRTLLRVGRRRTRCPLARSSVPARVHRSSSFHVE
jgi:hypothetical protein